MRGVGLAAARRRHAVQHTVQLVVLEDGVFVEALDECAPVVAGGQHSIVFELDDGFLNGDAAHPQISGDFVAVDPVAGS